MTTGCPPLGDLLELPLAKPSQSQSLAGRKTSSIQPKLEVENINLLESITAVGTATNVSDGVASPERTTGRLAVVAQPPSARLMLRSAAARSSVGPQYQEDRGRSEERTEDESHGVSGQATRRRRRRRPRSGNHARSNLGECFVDLDSGIADVVEARSPVLLEASAQKARYERRCWREPRPVGLRGQNRQGVIGRRAVRNLARSAS
jgi:hypothetical protein